jgi:dTDP-4-dehydrorhamnose 3,5-epimerase
MIKGIIIREISRYEDPRGWIAEVYRRDFDKYVPAMSYVSYTKFNVVRGPHEHREQTDFFVFVGPGDFEVCLWDNRMNSETYKEHMKLVAGETNRVCLIVPPGIVHGYKSISRSGSFCINLPDRLYRGENKREDVDEIRHEEDPDSEFKIK